MREDGRSFFDIRPVKIIPHIMPYAEGSAEIQMGSTKVICTASVEDNVPKWLSSSGQGWVTAEYNMLPRSTSQRKRRERAVVSGRTQEISRLIGRALRAVCHLKHLPSKQILIDCDVIQADGGTRTASITGGFVALALAVQKLLKKNIISENPLLYYVSAISVVLHENQLMVDPTAKEDQSCSTDMNFVFSNKGNLIEIQGTAEKTPFELQQLTDMIKQGQTASQQLFQQQAQILNDFFPFVNH